MNNLDRITLNIPLQSYQALHIIGDVASKMPYDNGMGMAAQYLCGEIAKNTPNIKIEVPLKAVDVLVKMVDFFRAQGNKKAVHELDKLILVLKGGFDRKVHGAFIKAINGNMFKETDDGKFKAEFVIEKPVNIRKI